MNLSFNAIITMMPKNNNLINDFIIPFGIKYNLEKILDRKLLVGNLRKQMIFPW